MELYFIRHTSVDVAPGVCYGITDVPLKSTFPEEAEAVKRRLEGIKFDKVFTSPLTRARRLAAWCGYPEAQIEQRVSEIDYGEWEMTRFADNKDPKLNEWYADWQRVNATGGESFQDQMNRVSAFIDDVKQLDCERVAVFCHGGVLICAALSQGLCTIDNIPVFGYGEILTLTV